MQSVLKPPSGPGARRLVAFVTLAIAVPRLGPFADIVSRYATLHLLPAQAYGATLTMLGVLLLVTYPKRLTWYGRLVAVLTFGGFVTLAVDSIAVSVVSGLVSFVLAYALWGEVIAHE